MTETQSLTLFIGTYNRRGSQGIYTYRLDLAKGALERVSACEVADNPSYLALHPSGRYLYAINEVNEFHGQPGGGMTALAIGEDGALTVLNQQSVVGTGPCYVSVDATGRYAFSANYAGGSVCMLPIAEDGRLGQASHFVQHQGTSVLLPRQGQPHAHSIVIDPTNRFAFVPDLGMDKIMIYRLDLAGGKLLPNEAQAFAPVAPGSGPRHFTFHPNGRFAYVITEIASTIIVFRYDDGAGTLEQVQSVSTLPAGYRRRSHTADIHFSVSGKWLYGSNRGHDSLAIYAVDGESGRLTLVGHEPTRGMIPRNFFVEPTGAYVLVGHQESDSIVVFRLDNATGGLEPLRPAAHVPLAVCIKSLPA
jgi:6-phosphogluconolactonase